MAAADPRARPRAALPPLRGAEVAATAAAVAAAYGGALLAMHLAAARRPAGPPAGPPAAAGRAESAQGYWGTLPNAWDHPEPNYVVSEAIGEFWSVLTTIPVAGALLLYQGLKYHYGGKVLRIYALTCGMYSLAFTAHLTLQRHVFSTTVVSVMSNALLTFAQFSAVVHRFFGSSLVRGAVVLCAEAALVGTVATLPYALSANGGVWTLFAVQAPGVLLATCLAAGLAWRARRPEERMTYRTVCCAGCLLSTAMALSLIECLFGFEYGYIDRWWGFPWLHIAIHVLEQVGIYVFGVGIAALEQTVLQQPARAGAELRYVGPLLAYLYCPHLPGDASSTPALAPARMGADPDAKQQARPPASALDGKPSPGFTAGAASVVAAPQAAPQGTHLRTRARTHAG